MSRRQGLGGLSAAAARLHAWLLKEAYPRWIEQGVDAGSGRCVEAIEADGTVRPQPLRVRVQARQIFSLAHAPQLGFKRNVHDLLVRGLNFLSLRFQRRDGLFRTQIRAEGGPDDERALLYDQCFVLLAYASAATLLCRADLESRALALRAVVERSLRACDGAFHSDLTRSTLRETNPHMHLLEACLAWEEIGADPGWRILADELLDLALTRFIRADNGVLMESYAADGLPSPGIAGRLFEPGHQFEWAWLLLRAQARHGAKVRAPALRMLEVAERFGVRDGFAVNALLDDFSMHDAAARLWPQTERLKAALWAALDTQDARYGAMACSAAHSLFAYFNRQTAGLWFDARSAQGRIVVSCAPGSTLYHLVGAIAALQRLAPRP